MAVERKVKINRNTSSKAGKDAGGRGQNGILQDLLNKTRQVSRALQNRRDGDSLDYVKLAKLLSE